MKICTDCEKASFNPHLQQVGDEIRAAVGRANSLS